MGVAKIKDEAFKQMQEDAKKSQEEYNNWLRSKLSKLSPKKKKVLKEVVEYDEFGNGRIVLKEVEEDGPKKAPKTKNLTEKTIIDEFGNKKTVFVDDEGNIVDAKDIEYVTEQYIDEFGNVKYRKVAKIKDESFKQMQEDAKNSQEKYNKWLNSKLSNISPKKKKVLKEVVEYDEFGNARIVLKEVEEDGPKKAPKTKNLTEKTIIDEFGNKKTFFVD